MAPAVIAGTADVSLPFIDDTTSGIDPAKFYTHAIDFGSGDASAGTDRPVVAGVPFYTVTADGVSQIGQYGIENNQPNNGAVNANTSVIAGTGLNDMLRDLKWGQNAPGTMKLTGLEPGATYEFRLYQRQWSSNNRSHIITFDDGSGSPSELTFNPDADPAAAVYLSYIYTAPPSGELNVSWVGDGVPDNTTLHLYGMTNELVEDGTWLHGKATSDNHYAIFLGKADGSNLRLVGRDTFRDWREAERHVMEYQPGDHIYLVSWDNPGAVGDPQMVIGDFDLPGGGSIGTTGTEWEVVERPMNSNPGDNYDPAALPSVGDLAALIGTGGWFSPVAAPNTTGPWGTNGYFAPNWSATSAEFIWGDTFDNLSQSNTNESYYLFRTIDSVLSGVLIDLANTTFSTAATQGDLVGNFTFVSSDDDDEVTYSFVAGEGDADNSKFQIDGDRLELGSFDFSGEDDGAQFTVRIQGSASESGLTERSFVLTVVGDSDADMLPDSWELAYAGEPVPPDYLDRLSGLGGADFDADDLTDKEEFDMNPTADPAGVSPINGDSDGDDLGDGDELVAGTDPTDPDSDGDFAFDGHEIEDGLDPLDKDSDDDFWGDGHEQLLGSDPGDPGSMPNFAAGVTLVPVTHDCSSGISDAVPFTHAVSGGTAATINGVAFDVLDAAATPADFLWDTAAFTKNIVANNLNDWSPASGGVTGAQMIELFDSFTYSSSGAAAGSTQQFTLSGLTPGSSYDLRLYIRSWSQTGAGRFIDLSFTNGAEVTVASPEGGAPEDLPGDVLMNGGNNHQAYYVNFRYTAQGTELVIDTNVPAGAAANNGSFHMYGLSNQLAAAGAPTDFAITAVSRAGDGSVTLTWNSEDGAQYGVDFSTALTPEGEPGGWQELTDSVASQGASTTFVDTVAGPAGAPTLLYRVRRASGVVGQ